MVTGGLNTSSTIHALVTQVTGKLRTARSMFFAAIANRGVLRACWLVANGSTSSRCESSRKSKRKIQLRGGFGSINDVLSVFPVMLNFAGRAKYDCGRFEVYSWVEVTRDALA
jgi:hypothetical protein